MKYPNKVAENATISPKYKEQAQELMDATLEEFFALCKVPRPTGHMDQIREYLLNWGYKHDVITLFDPSGCIIMDVPASKGAEKLPKVVLQCHMDMVAIASASNKNFDPETSPIKPILDTENNCIHTGWETSLGADDGQGIAIMLSIAKSKNITHGPLRLIFTYDEESNMQGVRELSDDAINAKYLINFDSIYVGMVLSSAAGAFYSSIHKHIQTINAPTNATKVSIFLSGLTGGHSGEDINKNRGSAIKIGMVFLESLRQNNINFNIHKINAGTFMNAIPAKLTLEIVLENEDVFKAKKIFEQVIAEAQNRYSDGKSLTYSTKATRTFGTAVLSISDSLKALDILQQIPNGVVELGDENVPVTSSNVGTITIERSKCEVKLLYRSSRKEQLIDANERLKKLAKDNKLDYVVEGIFPAWPKMENNPLNELFLKSYKEVCGFEGRAIDIHSGLECGYLSDRFPDLVMTSVGCDLINEHTRKETLFTKSMPAFMASLLYVLENIAEVERQ